MHKTLELKLHKFIERLIMNSHKITTRMKMLLHSVYKQELITDMLNYSPNAAAAFQWDYVVK